MMTRKDTSQELDRPHYYSQFWVDVAAGKRSVADVGSDAEPFEADDELPLALPEYETAVPARPAAKPKAAKPEKKPEPARPTITSLADLANIDLLMKNSAEMDGDEVPDLEAGAMDDLAGLRQTGGARRQLDTIQRAWHDRSNRPGTQPADHPLHDAVGADEHHIQAHEHEEHVDTVVGQQHQARALRQRPAPLQPQKSCEKRLGDGGTLGQHLAGGCIHDGDVSHARGAPSSRVAVATAPFGDQRDRCGIICAATPTVQPLG